jgi:hypothetical protein
VDQYDLGEEDAAFRSLERARAQLTTLSSLHPGHSRVARVAREAVDKVAKTLDGPCPPFLDKGTEIDDETIEYIEQFTAEQELSNFGKAQRAIDKLAQMIH